MNVVAQISEMTGSETNIYFDLSGKRHIARIKTDRKISAGESVELFIDAENAYFFDKDTTKNTFTVG